MRPKAPSAVPEAHDTGTSDPTGVKRLRSRTRTCLFAELSSVSPELSGRHPTAYCRTKVNIPAYRHVYAQLCPFHLVQNNLVPTTSNVRTEQDLSHPHQNDPSATNKLYSYELKNAHHTAAKRTIHKVRRFCFRQKSP